jgi:hypothetical protein
MKQILDADFGARVARCLPFWDGGWLRQFVHASVEQDSEQSGGDALNSKRDPVRVPVGLLLEEIVRRSRRLAQPASRNGSLLGSKRDRKIAASIGSSKQ